MLRQIRRWLLQLLRHVLSDAFATRLARLLSRRRVERLRGEATDGVLEALLAGMDVCFALSNAYRRNHLQGFVARYVFVTEDGKVGATASFSAGNMSWSKRALPDFTVRVTFKDAAALRRFLLSKSQDVLDALLNNEMETDGNINYIFKFGFMVRDLEHRLGLEP
jgi:hypothetical protein